MEDDRLQSLSAPALDYDGDGLLTLGDFADWGLALLLYPGDAAIALLMRHAPAVARFLELGSNTYGGTLALCLSILFWCLVLIALGLGLNFVRNLDRRITAWCAAYIDEGLRLGRVARRRYAAWIGQKRQRRKARNEAIDVAEIAVPSFDQLVLRCYADLGEMRVLAPDEVASTLRCSLGKVREALRRLQGYALVEPGVGTDAGRDGHQITRAGQIYLLER